jgi:hypothetical protein
MSGNIISDGECRTSPAKQIDSEVKAGVLEIYDELLGTVWAKIVPTLGTMTVVTIMQRAISRTGARHPAISHLTLSDAGFSFNAIHGEIAAYDKAELKNAFKELIGNIFDILAKLTGNILVQQLIKEVEGLDIEEA